MANQYFKVEIHGGNAYLHVYPPTDNGEVLSIREVTSYLELKQYKNYDLKAVNSAISIYDREQEVLIGTWDGIEISEMMDVTVSPDRMTVICRFYPATKGGRSLQVKEMLETLVLKGIKYGLVEKNVYDFLIHREYCKDYVFAVGKEPVQGQDAYVDYKFEVETNLQPKHNEDGSVNYKELNTISHINKGDLLARLIKEDTGVPGKNVFGEEILPRAVKKGKLQYGRNIELSEDGTELYSLVTGHVSLCDGKVFVSDVYEVPADVDNSTGNIEYDGNVRVHGNVKSGFVIRASGDIIVDGVVEGASLYSEGQIIVKHGIHGMHKGEFVADGNIMAKYIENAKVTANGYVEAEMILNSDVSSAINVKVKGKKGLISGGAVRAKLFVEADNIGSDMGTATTIEVGIDPKKKERYLDLFKISKDMGKDIEDMKLIVANYGTKMKKGDKIPKDKLLYAQKLAKDIVEKQEELKPLEEELNAILEEMKESDKSYVSVARNVFPGVIISISDLAYHVEQQRSYCRFVKKDGNVKPENM